MPVPTLFDATGTPISATNPLYVGPPTARTVVHPLAAETASGSSTPVAVGSFRELLLLINITAVTGTTPTLQFFFETSDDGGVTWYQLNTSTSYTSVGQSGFSFGAGVSGGGSGSAATQATALPLGDTFRVRWIIGGTTPSFTFKATAIGK